ncbi:MAG: hypothetical protein NC084_05990 [Bacteroides sp.]|nr:hypothetical protein [Bacteroides sp.]
MIVIVTILPVSLSPLRSIRRLLKLCSDRGFIGDPDRMYYTINGRSMSSAFFADVRTNIT